MESAARIGHYQWVEMRLFELIGGWVPVVPELEVKERLGVQCHHHAWHAEMWHERLPVMRGMDRDAFVVPANDAVAAGFRALAAPAEPDRTLEKLVGLYRVLLPELIAAYELHLGAATEIADGAVIRSLRLALRDELDQVADGEVLLGALLTDASAAAHDRAIAHGERLQAFFDEAGGVSGPRDDAV